MNTYYIYKVENNVNGKIYIGCTNNIGSRIRQHILASDKKDSEFHTEMNKYGITNFTWQIIDTCYAKEDAVVLEAKNIKKYDSVSPKGYNLSWNNGGMPRTKPFVCLELNGNFVKKYEYLSQVIQDGFDIHSVKESLKCETRTSNGHMFMYEDEYKKYGAKKYKKSISPCRKKIVQCDMNGKLVKEYESVSKAADETGFIRSNISANLTLQSKSCNGFIFVYKEEYPIKDLNIYRHFGKGIKTVQIDKDTNEIINIFDKTSDAGRYIGKSYKNIQKVLNKEDRTAYGYKWMDYDTYMNQYANTEVINQIAKG